MIVKALADDGIILKSTVWTRTLDDNFTACSDIRRLLKANFEREGISIPYRHIHVVTDGPLEREQREQRL